MDIEIIMFKTEFLLFIIVLLDYLLIVEHP